jgi:hypothetical protein
MDCGHGVFLIDQAAENEIVPCQRSHKERDRRGRQEGIIVRLREGVQKEPAEENPENDPAAVDQEAGDDAGHGCYRHNDEDDLLREFSQRRLREMTCDSEDEHRGQQAGDTDYCHGKTRLM